MKKSHLVFLIITLTVKLVTTFGQQDSTVRTRSVTKNPRLIRKTEWIAPAVFIIGGSAIALDKDADEFFLNNYEVWEERNENFVKFSHKADNYLQYAPHLIGMSLSLCGVRGRNDLANQTAILIKSELLLALVVYPLKTISKETRPDSSTKNSFPSGHTAQAFAAATFLAKEYGKKSVWYSIGGYTIATAVATMRVLNNRHWISDVVVGAGIGILCTNIVYATHKHKWGGKKNNLTFTPTYNKQSIGFYVNYKF